MKRHMVVTSEALYINVVEIAGATRQKTALTVPKTQ